MPSLLKQGHIYEIRLSKGEFHQQLFLVQASLCRRVLTYREVWQIPGELTSCFLKSGEAFCIYREFQVELNKLLLISWTEITDSHLIYSPNCNLPFIQQSKTKFTLSEHQEKEGYRTTKDIEVMKICELVCLSYQEISFTMPGSDGFMFTAESMVLIYLLVFGIQAHNSVFLWDIHN